MTSDRLRFFRTWLRKPMLTGAVSPSGAALARAMAKEIPADGEWPILELGPGTGPVTAALIERGITPERIVSVEFNPEFCALLVERFRGLNVVEGDAYDLASALPPGLAGPYAAAVSSLPLLTRPADMRLKLVDAVLDRVLPGGALVQFSYGFGPPVKAVPGRFAVSRGAFVLANLPPARVWAYRAERRSAPR
ncbi:MAG: phospholipid methyltransferase [Bauldia sp.]|nr:phospholipid methyltransferase [Bauldia sp.]